MKSSILLAAMLLLTLSCQTSNLKNRSMNNISSQHPADKAVSAKPLFKGEEGSVVSLQIQKDGLLDKHITKVPALLVCVSGEVIFEDERGLRQTLSTGDYHHIEAQLTHWVSGVRDSQLLLIK